MIYILSTKCFMNWELILKTLSFIFEVFKFVKKLCDNRKKKFKKHKNKNNRKPH